MNRLVFFSLVATMFLWSLNACVYNDEETLYPQPTTPIDTCNISTVSYANDVVPILQNNCYVCHDEQNAPFAGASIVLEGHANAKTVADNGRLGGSINHEVPFSPMPKGGAKLPECELKTINQWIEDGSPDN